ncbi:hypothetical protein J6590_075812 [Homalodisca vitripennis]|nr:hypothetical protein J6590_075812 [Homalodisca vitripennis]
MKAHCTAYPWDGGGRWGVEGLINNGLKWCGSTQQVKSTRCRTAERAVACCSAIHPYTPSTPSIHPPL